MMNIVNFPLLLFAISFMALWLSALVGAFFRQKVGPLKEGEREDFEVVQGAALTLLGLLIGFTFSMAITRYEQRKTYEQAEADAIRTEYIRADLLPAADAGGVRDLLRTYLDHRLLFYTSDDTQQRRQINAETEQLQNQLWTAVQAHGTAQPTTTTALAVSGMNDVLNAQGYTQAAWWNRIPLEAWILLAAIAIGCNLMIGYGAHRTSLLLIIFPIAVSLSFFLIADIDSPRGGVIRVQPQNLMRLSQTLSAH
jgi:hypothetical protein